MYTFGMHISLIQFVSSKRKKRSCFIFLLSPIFSAWWKCFHIQCTMHNVGDPISSRDYLKFYSTLANIVVDLNGTKIERLRNNL